MNRELEANELTITSHSDGNAEGAGEYRAHIEGSDKIGRLTWIMRDGVRVAEHTLVPKEIGGRGVAARLVDALITDAREQGFKVDPQCSYIAKKFEQNPDWDDLRG